MDQAVTAVRKVMLPPDTLAKAESYRAWQCQYMFEVDTHERELIPSTEIWLGNRLALKTNSLGCKGEELVHDVPVIGFFGDSATFGISTIPRSWPQFVGVDGYQMLNAAIEGARLDRVVERCLSIADRVPLAGAVVNGGWNDIWRDEQHWQACFDRLPEMDGIAICTLATCLRDECAERGIESLIRTQSERAEYGNYFEYNVDFDDQQFFNFWCYHEPSLENVRTVFEQFKRFNAFVHDYCAKKGFLLIDLYSAMLPERYEEIPRDFFDICHPRPSAYGRIARYVSEQLRPRFANSSNRRRDSARLSVSPTASPVRPTAPEIPRNPDLTVSQREEDDGDDLRRNLYPLW